MISISLDGQGYALHIARFSRNANSSLLYWQQDIKFCSVAVAFWLINFQG
jgi:hypothetical protein